MDVNQNEPQDTSETTPEPMVEKKPSQFNKDMLVGASILVIVTAVVSAYIIFSSRVVSDSLGVSSATNVAASPQADKQYKSDNAGSVWGELLALGLQGEHYTLNIHGKNDSFSRDDCSVEEGSASNGGNNIFIPENGDASDNNQIIMQSGNTKGKWAQEGATDFGVRDACTAPFDGDAAELTLPPSEKGYYVTARILGKPTENPELMLEGDLLFVQDEFGNDLLVLGLVTDNGFETPTQKLTRTKGKTKATDITGLFEWSGNVCYFDSTNYCYDEAENYMCTDTQLCCADVDGDGIVDECTDPVALDDGSLSCEVGDLTDLACRDYLNEWVFNIGDLVGYMWNVSASGDFKLANIRFYPVK